MYIIQDRTVYATIHKYIEHRLLHIEARDIHSTEYTQNKKTPTPTERGKIDNATFLMDFYIIYESWLTHKIGHRSRAHTQRHTQLKRIVNKKNIRIEIERDIKNYKRLFK